MKRLAILFAVAVIAPSLVLAWLALRSLRDQQFVLERQQFLLCQNIADSLARDVDALVEERQREFAAHVEALLATNAPLTLAPKFDDHIRSNWPIANVGFVVSMSGTIYSPALVARNEARQFRLENDQFLASRASAEVYWSNVKGGSVNPDNNRLTIGNSTFNNGGTLNFNSSWSNAEATQNRNADNSGGQSLLPSLSSIGNNISLNGNNSYGQAQRLRNVAPRQQQADVAEQIPQQQQAFGNLVQNVSKLASTEAEFRQLVGDSTEGTVARFLQNRLNLMLWYRPPRTPDLVFGALLDLAVLREQLRNVPRVEPALTNELAVALLDENARPVSVTPSRFTANWKRPFVATEVGEALPHWELAVYLLNPDRIGQTARVATLTLALLIGVLVVAIVVGSWLIVGDVRRQLAVARQKTDFVSNVSHELKTPLTAIRMFAELLSEGRAAPDKQRQYFGIITAEAARLTRLINNVLDFARFDRGEKQFELQPCDLAQVVGETVSGYRAHLEAAGFTLEYDAPATPVRVRADRDALAQIVVNLLSNAEKYSNGSRTITVTLAAKNGSENLAEVSVLDRGPGVLRGCEEKIFEQFFRAHDSLASGIQGSGLGLTLARQIARAHGGDVTYAPRGGGGSCFALRLPLADNAQPLSS